MFTSGTWTRGSPGWFCSRKVSLDPRFDSGVAKLMLDICSHADGEE